VKSVVFTVVAVIWFSLGMGLIIAQAWTVEIIERLLSDEFRLFMLIQLEMIISLALIVGTYGFPFRLFWIVLGCLGLLKGLFLTWAPLGQRESFLDWSVKRPFWEYRVCGIILVALATALVYGVSLL
jgi:hypothetical protein